MTRSAFDTRAAHVRSDLTCAAGTFDVLSSPGRADGRGVAEAALDLGGLAWEPVLAALSRFHNESTDQPVTRLTTIATATATATAATSTARSGRAFRPSGRTWRAARLPDMWFLFSRRTGGTHLPWSQEVKSI
jgi:hypothetical protein